MATITDTAIAKALKDAKATSKRLELSDTTPGLRMRVSPSGRRVWVWAGKDQLGAVRRHILGDYPALAIGPAREKALATRQAVKFDGADPTQARRRTRQKGADARAGIGTLGSLVNMYAARTDKPSWAKGAPMVRLVFAPILDCHLSTLTVDDLHGAMRLDNTPGSANKKGADFAARTLRSWLNANAETKHLGAIKSAKPNVRERVLSQTELTSIFRALARSTSPHDRAMRLLFWTACRLDEVISSTWDEFDLATGEWKSARKTKTGDRIDMILPLQATSFLKSIRPKEIAVGQLVFSTKSGKKLGNWDRATKQLQALTKTEGWHRHDIRRTAATCLGELGTMPEIVEAALGHKVIHSKLAQVYNKSRYKPEVKAALQILADFYDKL